MVSAPTAIAKTARAATASVNEIRNWRMGFLQPGHPRRGWDGCSERPAWPFCQV